MNASLARTLAVVAALVAVPPVLADEAADRALLEAVNAGSPGRTCRQSLARGADPNVTFGRFYEQKPLCIATERGKEALLRTMIDAGARVDFVYEEREAVSISPLQCAAVNDNLAAFEMLHQGGRTDPTRLLPELQRGATRPRY